MDICLRLGGLGRRRLTSGSLLGLVGGLTVCLALRAALGLCPPLLLEEVRLRIREEDLALAALADNALARGLHLLLGLKGRLAIGLAIRAAARLLPALLLEEDLILSREGEDIGAVTARDLQILRERRALSARPTRREAARTTLGLLIRLLLLGLCDLLQFDRLRALSLHLGLKACNPLGNPREKILHGLRIISKRDPTKHIVTLRLRLEEDLLGDERHSCERVRKERKCADSHST